MPLRIYQLDTNYPPTWQGTAAQGVTPLTDPATASGGTGVRFVNGQDPVNYFTYQRVEGDLFKRDLELLGSEQKIVDYMGSRTGISLNIPATLLEPPDGGVSHYITLGRLPVSASQIPHIFIVASDVTCQPIPGATGISPSGCVLQLTDASGNIVFNRDATRNASFTISSISASAGSAVIYISGTGIQVGDAIIVSGASSSANNGVYPVTSVSGSYITVSEASGCVSQSSGGTVQVAYFMAAQNTDRGPYYTTPSSYLTAKVVNMSGIETVVSASIVWLPTEW